MTKKLKQEDLATLTSRWWPAADLETLLDLAQFVACIFSTDGMIDQASGPGKDKTQAFQALHRSTDNFVEQRLDMSHDAKVPRPSDSLTNSFRVLSGLLRKRYTTEQQKMFLDEAKFTMDMLSLQQKLRLDGKIPTLEEYCTYRQGSCCINAMVALVEYGNNLHIPAEVMNNPDMKVLKKEAVHANWMYVIFELLYLAKNRSADRTYSTNDIVSVKKELVSETDMSLLL
ncbi:hypothetical protein GJ744_000636 [Endocarpon pusillum]|uniref:Uncharacterized protein n=1 Tax=Endocarpon pusillum TaxID=364733 RepID=A0A8H7E3S7_9EURO|nr:hypothetical protein GJ744_000636 [Endocarpon pusillum]